MKQVGGQTATMAMHGCFAHIEKKKAPDVTIAFKSALDKLAEQEDADHYTAIFNFDSS